MHSYENYDLREDDPYVIPGSGCLKNKLGVTDTAALNILERQITGPMLISIQRNPVIPTFDLQHLCNIHRRLFSRIYPFAGEIRHVEIAKGGRLFLPHGLIRVIARKVFFELEQENYLLGCDEKLLCERVGYYFAALNTIHPFREGNGRTQRILIDQLIAKNGYAIRWSAISGLSIAEASAASLAGDKSGRALVNLVKNNIFKL